MKNLTLKLSYLAAAFLIAGCVTESLAQKPKPPAGGRIAVVIDERLAALRSTPNLSGTLLRRLGRGRLVAVRALRTTADGVGFFLVNVSARTHGWIQVEAVVAPWHAGDEQRLLRMIRNSTEFEGITRARIFLDYFWRSQECAEVLQLLGAAAEEVAAKLSREAARRLEGHTDEASEFSYFLNYSALDRYNRQGVKFVFDRTTKQFHYDGAAWKEIVCRYSHSAQVEEARKRLATLSELMSKK